MWHITPKSQITVNYSDTNGAICLQNPVIIVNYADTPEGNCNYLLMRSNLLSTDHATKSTRLLEPSFVVGTLTEHRQQKARLKTLEER